MLLGFDAREAWLPDGGWDDRRRRSFLLRHVRKPLSIDPAVWRSVFDLVARGRPPYTGTIHGLWQDLERLEEHLEEVRTWPGEIRVAAFAVHTAACTIEESSALESFLAGVSTGGDPAPRPPPANVDPSWSFLGYDVADLAATSALSNMGLVPDLDNIQALRARWGPWLDDHHLFADASQAEAFKNASNRRTPEHAPFFVIGIWQPKETATPESRSSR